MKSKTRKLCQCCNQSERQWVLASAYKDEPAYEVCSNCLLFLTTNSLRPEMYKNLLKNGHKATEFLLHDDFYDDDGNALQPFMDLNVNELNKCPYCDSDNISAGEQDYFPNHITREITCEKCGKQWDETYRCVQVDLRSYPKG